MTAADTRPTPASDALEREKWEAEHAFRERELAIKEREQEKNEAELALAQKERAASRWKNPLVVALLAAAVAATGNALVAYLNGASQTKLEGQRSEQARILEMIKTGSPDKAAENLRFLVDAGLIRDAGIRRDLTGFLDKRKPGSGPALPSGFTAAKLVSKFEGTRLRPYKDRFGATVIGADHVLTQEELRSGKLVIGGRSVDFRSGITQEQANQLLEKDLDPIRRHIEKLVTVELTVNQKAALTSFVYNVGLGSLQGSNLLKKLNAGKYDDVPAELMKWVHASGRTLPALVARRRSEVALWNKH
jgi:GH24 family phage-related lysozyme (muramidase)